MKAIITTLLRPIQEPDALIDTERPRPVATRWDLLVRVEAVSINPVDTKVRAGVEDVDGVVLGCRCQWSPRDCGCRRRYNSLLRGKFVEELHEPAESI